MLGASELNVSACGVAEGVVTLCLFPVTVTVVQQSVRKVGSCSLDVRVRCCRVQWCRKRRRDRLKVGRGGVELIGARRPEEVVEPRRAERGGGESTVGGRAVVWARWGITIQDRGLASCPSYGSWGTVTGVNGV